MPVKRYVVRFKQSDMPTQLVVASSTEVHGEHLVFLYADGGLAALFVQEILESWAEVTLD